MRQRSQRIARWAGIACIAWLGVGCAWGLDAWGYKAALEDAQRSYTHGVRWGEHQRAGKYVDPDWQPEFNSNRKQLNDFHITDYEVRSFDVDDGRTSATVEVMYYGYRMQSMTAGRIRETQEWVRDSLQRQWQVRPSLASNVETGE